MFEQLIDPIVTAMGGILAGVLVALALRALKKMGIELDVQKQQQLESVARAAVLRVEEVAKSQARKHLADWSGPEKLQAAVTEVVDRLPRVDRDEAERIVHAVLPTVGIGAAAAVELGKALQTK
jgi:ERCC4-type nuclease